MLIFLGQTLKNFPIKCHQHISFLRTVNTFQGSSTIMFTRLCLNLAFRITKLLSFHMINISITGPVYWSKLNTPNQKPQQTKSTILYLLWKQFTTVDSIVINDPHSFLYIHPDRHLKPYNKNTNRTATIHFLRYSFPI